MAGASGESWRFHTVCENCGRSWVIATNGAIKRKSFNLCFMDDSARCCQDVILTHETVDFLRLSGILFKYLISNYTVAPVSWS